MNDHKYHCYLCIFHTNVDKRQWKDVTGRDLIWPEYLESKAFVFIYIMVSIIGCRY